MTPVHRIAQGMANEDMLKKMNRDTYAKLLESERKAKEFAARYKKCRTA